MRIAVMGCQCNGKTTFVKEFIKRWPMFKTPEKTYRDFLKEGKIKINEEGTKESQQLILDALVDEVQHTDKEENTIFDRCVVDNIVYSLWHHEKNSESGIDFEFVDLSRKIVFETLRMYDIIFFLPARDEFISSLSEQKETRSKDLLFREEIDTLYKSLVKTYEQNIGSFFPIEDCPAVITLAGPPDLRIEQVRLYLKDNGTVYGEEDGSLISGV